MQEEIVFIDYATRDGTQHTVRLLALMVPKFLYTLTELGCQVKSIREPKP